MERRRRKTQKVAALPAGTVLHSGAYRLDSLVGRGSFGLTYRATDTRTQKLVAIKECFPAGCEREGLQVVAGDLFSNSHLEKLGARMRASGEKLIPIAHPSLVAVHEVWEENGTVYMAMDWLDGATLSETVEKDGTFPIEIALRRGNEVAGALEALHSAGLLHLDIKPENVILSDGRAVLIDFDLLQSRDGNDLSTRPLSLATQCGTPGYAPLEQYAQNIALSTASDVYALGATLYHLLTGSPPPSAVDRAAGQSLETPTLKRADIPEFLAQALEKSLALRSDERFQSVTGFRASWVAPAPQVVAPAIDDDAVQFTAQQVALSQAKLVSGVYRVVLTEATPIFPGRCVCCADKVNGKTQITVNSPFRKWSLPVCNTCLRHEKAARAADVVTFWGLGVSAVLAVAGGWISVSTGSVIPLILCLAALLVCFGSMSYGALKSSRAEEMMKDNCCNVADPVAYNYNGRVHIWRFKCALYAEEFKKKNAAFVV